MPARPDLCVMGYDLRASGVVRNALRIAGAAAAAGLCTDLWVMREDGPLRAELPPGVRLRSIDNPGPDLGRSLGLIRGQAALAGYLDAEKPAIALSSGNHMHGAAARAFKAAGKPPGVRLWARASNATLNHPAAAYLGRPLPRPAAALIDRVNRLQYAGFSRIVAVCAELGNQLTDDLGIDRRIISVIPNGVDVPAITAKAEVLLDHPWMQQDAPPVILAAGRLSRQKNFADLIRALPLVRRDLAARLVILGPGQGGEAARLERLAQSLGVAGHVLLPGFEANPFRWMARAAVFGVSSRWEGSSNVVLEALACGAPVAAYRCPTGIAEVLEPLGAGRLAAPGDVAGLAAALLRAIRAPRDPETAVNHARRFDLAKTLASYVALFEAELRSGV